MGLEKLFKKKTHVGISVSANNFIELVGIDKATKAVITYASSNVKYNNAIKELISYEELPDVIEQLFEEAGLDQKDCSVTFNLPNVHFGITTLANASEEPYIIENLQSEIEDLYIFKRNEPVISYTMIDSPKDHSKKNIIYSALQEKAVSTIIEVFDGLQCDLERIDTSYSSFLKTLQYCEKFNQYLTSEDKTSVILITPNSCCTFNLIGAKLADYTEEPLAVKSFSTEEVYTTISKIIETNISKNAPQNLLLISETDEVNSELLSSRVQFEGNVDFLNKSVNANDSFIDISESSENIDANMISYMTLEAVGAAVASYGDFSVDINALPQDRINKNIIEINGYETDFNTFIIFVLTVAIVFALLVGFGTKFFLDNQRDGIAQTQKSIQRKTKDFKQRYEAFEKNKQKNIFPVLEKIISENESTINVYEALSTDIPENIYIKKFVTNASGGIGILGEAQTSESVNEFVNSLREKNGDLMLSKLSVNTQNDFSSTKQNTSFSFEIKTSKQSVSFDDAVLQNPIQTTVKRKSSSSKRKSMTPPPPII